MKDLNMCGVNTQCVHAGATENIDGAVVTPIYQTSTFKFKNADHGARLFRGEEDGYIYTRMRNPTVEAMENAVALLEGGAKALGCGSGMAAIHTLFATVLEANSHIVCSSSVYGPTMTILENFFSKFGVETTFVNTENAQEIEDSVKDNTKLIYIETPGNPTLSIADISAASLVAKKAGIKLAVDNTFMSPIMQKPFDHGADYIIHSLTKSLNGHADVVGGIIVVKEESEYPKFRKTLNLLGGVIDPFNSFLVHRGLKTLSLRVKQASDNAHKVAQFLESHDKVETVWYPGLESHPQHELAKKQMSGFGAMIAIELKGGFEAGKKLMNQIELLQLAVSLGGIESLIQHPASMTHSSMGEEGRRKAQITDGLVRISIGIEQSDDIINALKNALELV